MNPNISRLAFVLFWSWALLCLKCQGIEPIPTKTTREGIEVTVWRLGSNVTKKEMRWLLYVYTNTTDTAATVDLGIFPLFDVFLISGNRLVPVRHRRPVHIFPGSVDNSVTIPPRGSVARTYPVDLWEGRDVRRNRRYLVREKAGLFSFEYTIK